MSYWLSIFAIVIKRSQHKSDYLIPGVFQLAQKCLFKDSRPEIAIAMTIKSKEMGGRHSTEEAFALPTQPSRVQII